MGRNKIDIKREHEARKRRERFKTRVGGLFNKAYELSKLCGLPLCVLVAAEDGNNYFYQSEERGRSQSQCELIKAASHVAKCWKKQPLKTYIPSKKGLFVEGTGSNPQEEPNASDSENMEMQEEYENESEGEAMISWYEIEEEANASSQVPVGFQESSLSNSRVEIQEFENHPLPLQAQQPDLPLQIIHTPLEEPAICAAPIPLEFALEVDWDALITNNNAHTYPLDASPQFDDYPYQGAIDLWGNAF